MIRRPLRPTFSFESRKVLLEAMGCVRQLAIGYGSAGGYNSGQYRLAHALTRAIDALATELTGDPTYFHGKPHGGGGK